MAKILIVEDDNHLREIYELRMQAAGHEVVSAADGEEALKVAIKEKPDLVISDVMMPKISGFDMLDILRSTEETKNAKVIMMTALSQSEDKQRAENLGADRYLVKSQVTLDDVAQVTEEVLSGTSPSSQPAQTDTPSDTTQPTAPATDPQQATTAQQSTPAPAQSAPAPAPAPVQAPEPQTQQPTQADTPADGNPPASSNDPQNATKPATTPAPQPAPQPQQDDQTTGQPAANDDSAESEESAIAKQIESFMHSKDGEQPTEVAQPPTQDTPESSNPASPQQPTEAAQETTPTTTPQNEPSPENTETAAPETTTSVTDDAPSKKKKVIQPINDLTASKSDELTSLLKKEEVREEMSKVVNDIQTKDVADLSNDSSAGDALKAAQSEFSQVAQSSSQPQQTQNDSGQDIKITDEGKIVGQDPEEAQAAEVLKAAQAASTTPPSEPVQSPQTQPAEQPVQQAPAPAPADPALQPAPAPEQTTAQQTASTVDASASATPVIPHTNGTSMDGVMPQGQPQPQSQQQEATPPAPAPAPQPAPTQQNTTSPNPNDIAL